MHPPGIVPPVSHRALPGACALALLAACAGSDPRAFWAAMAEADPAAARLAATGDGQRRCANALGTALAGGSAGDGPARTMTMHEQ